jgi:hypothetical protein
MLERLPPHQHLAGEKLHHFAILVAGLATVIMPRSGFERDGVTASTSLSTCSTSPGRVGRGQEISPPAPISPPAMGMSLLTSSDMVMAAVCQPLAARPLKKLVWAATSSVWKG